MKKGIISLVSVLILAAAIVAAWYFWFRPSPLPTETNTITPVVNEPSQSQTTGPESEMEAYTDPDYNFSLEYSADFKKAGEDENARLPWSAISPKPGRRLVTINLPKEFEAGTNFSEGTISVGVAADAGEVGACLLGDTENPEKVTINGSVFTKLNSSDAGAGNLYETDSYRIVRNNICLALETTIHSTNIGNYPPEAGIKEFNKARVKAALEEVVQSFRFN